MTRDAYAEHFDGFADWCVGTSPLYERLARRIGDDADLLDLAAETPEGRSPAHLLLGAVHFLLLDGREHRLADYYPTVTDDPLAPDESVDPANPDGDAFSAFRDFCLSNTDEIRSLVTTRRTQTNSVRRCAALYPAFEEVLRRATTDPSDGDRRPLALVEVGPSAGLNLLWDRYGYDYGDAGRCGDLDSPVRIESAVMNPLDVTDPDDARWLKALVWPEHDDRHRLLDAAVEVAHRNPPDLREGDALDLLPDVVAEIPADRPICLFNTQVRYQLDDGGRERFESLVAELAADRELYSLSGDRSADEYDQGIELTLRTPGTDGETERLGVYEQHGAWIAWDE
ncbi:DUF2332 domain-containing protein [Halobacteriales archaeon SW_6_65_15]|nr:MAG: DUF2332 domain-containing protein [Halobacteriales archaeon SW_6_65_15]